MDFCLSILDTDLKTGLRMHGWPIEHPAILQREPGFMPRTHNAVADQLTPRQPPAEMIASLCHRKNPILTANQQDWHTIVFDAGSGIPNLF